MSSKHFFKKSKKNTLVGKNKKESPSNSRTITEPFRFLPKINSVLLLRFYRGSLKVFIIFIFVLAAIIVGLDLNVNIKAKQSIDLEREELTRELKFWESFIAKHTDYADAYFQASVLEYKLGDTSKAKMYAEKGLVLDPNSEDGRRIEELLSK